ncbi:MAG: DUF4394 domain-containing protein [Planctomycetes bacterium]|nr:DUF4394 domain-containing protein [Planctomycetota bacterium]
MNRNFVPALAAFAAATAFSHAALTVYGVTRDNRLVSFSSATPGSIDSNVAITGLANGESVLGIDARPSTIDAQLVAVTSANRLVSISPAGVATGIGAGFSPALESTTLGIDFNPTVDRVRVVHASGANRRLNPVNGANAALDTALTYNDGSGLTPRAVGTAYNSFTFGQTAPLGSVRQYIIDSARDILGEVGSQAGGNASFNGGVVTPVGPLGFDLSDDAGFDVFGPTQQAFISSRNANGAAFYSLNLATGAASSLGSVGADIIDFTVVPAPGVTALLGIAALAAGRQRR